MSTEQRRTCKKNSGEEIRQELFFNLTEEDSAPNAFAIHCIWYGIAVTLIFVVLFLLHICIADNSIAMPGLLSAACRNVWIFYKPRKPWPKYVLVLLSVIAVTVISIFLTYHTILTSIIPLLIAAQYSRRRVIWLAYVLSIIITVVIVAFGYQYGLCDANMVMQTVSKASVYGRYLSSAVSPVFDRWPTIILFFALPRCLLLTAFVPMINAIVINKKDIIQRDIKITKRVADSIASSLKDNMDAYRFGGDEFMVVISDGKECDAENLIGEWKHKLNLINNMPGFIDCKIACGFASGSGNDFSEVLRRADKNMYDKKC